MAKRIKTPPHELGALCNECPFGSHWEEYYVPCETNSKAEFAVVGNNPNQDDLKERRPFMGKSGNMVTEALYRAGASRSSAHWTNVVACVPPDKRMDEVLNDIKKQNRATESQNRRAKKEGGEILPTQRTPHECCTPRLRRELGRFKNIIVLGTTAIKAVVHRSASILDLRGGPMTVERSEDDIIHILPSLHPEMVERNMRWYDAFQIDMARAVKWFRRGLDWKAPNVLYQPRPEQLQQFLYQPDVSFWTYDVETDAKECLTARLRCIAIGTPEAVVVIGYLGIDGRTRFYTPEEEYKITQILKVFFEDSSILKAGHNAGYYDKIVMREQLDIHVDPCLDTMLMHRLVESELPHSLGYVGSIYTEAPSWKTDRQGRKKAYGSETDFELHEYCAWDTAVTAAVLPPLLKSIKRRKQSEISQCDHKLQEICADMHTVGMYVDQSKRKSYETHFLREVNERREKIRTIVDLKNLNPASPNQLRDLLYDKWRLDPPVDDKIRFTASGDPSTSDDILRAMLTIKSLSVSQRAAIKEIRLYRRVQKLLGTYVTKLRYSTQEAWGGWDDEDSWMEKELRDRYGVKKLGIVSPETGRMYPGYNAHVTTSGRLSSSSPINAQNFPGSLRSMVVAAPGNVLVGADMDQLELRIAASRWHSEKYLKAFEDGLDPHSSVTAYTVFGKRFEQAAMECGAGPFPWSTGTKFAGNAKKLRGLSKSVQYASQYWATVETVHRVITQTETDNGDGTTDLPYLSMSVREVRLMHQKWCEGARFDAGWENELNTYRGQGYLVEPIMGRRRDFLDGENPNEIVNFPIQAAGASLMNIALIELHRRIPLHKWGVGTGIINQCHDSIAVECPEKHAEWVKEQIEDVMNMVHDALPRVEFTAAADIGHHWGEV